MIKVGEILIDPNDISSIHKDRQKQATGEFVQIIYKNGVVKNLSWAELGLNYDEFIEQILVLRDKAEEDRLFRLIAALKSMNNG